jgi:hypothetical protein
VRATCTAACHAPRRATWRRPRSWSPTVRARRQQCAMHCIAPSLRAPPRHALCCQPIQHRLCAAQPRAVLSAHRASALRCAAALAGLAAFADRISAGWMAPLIAMSAAGAGAARFDGRQYEVRRVREIGAAGACVPLPSTRLAGGFGLSRRATREHARRVASVRTGRCGSRVEQRTHCARALTAHARISAHGGTEPICAAAFAAALHRHC